MIQTELLNDGTLCKHWSDLGVFLRQVETGALYPDPIDIYPCPYHYEETEEKIEKPEEEKTEFEKLRDQYVTGEIDLIAVEQAFEADLISMDEYVAISNTEVKIVEKEAEEIEEKDNK